MDIAIYGAQGIALGAYEAIHNLSPSRNIRCFLVTERKMNTEYLSNLPVLELEYFSNHISEEEKENIEILIATPEDVMSEIEKSLDACGLFCHVRLTSSRWAMLMGYHYAANKMYVPLSAYPVGYHKANMHVFMAKFYRDRPLAGRNKLPEWVTPIQVGAALCEERVANLLDCDGENISEKNRKYSELTALYWIWKNRLRHSSANPEHEYYGLIHYRRMLELSEDDVLRLVDNEVDVVLPYPMPYEPNIEVHHERYLKEEDWNGVLKAVEELQPDYVKVCQEILSQQYLYNYNILVARKEVLEKYCNWLFPILERVEVLSVPKEKDRKDRYIGYIGETLTTLYFMANRERLVIAHAGCKIFL